MTQLNFGFVEDVVEDTPVPVEFSLRENYAPVQLTSPQLVDRFWPQIHCCLAPCVERALHGEYTMEALYQMVMQSRVALFVVTNDPLGQRADTDVSLAFVVEPVLYPNLNAVNILALGGRDLANHKKFWGYFKGWAYMNGARTIEASVGPAMMRILTQWGFEPVYTVARCSLTEPA